jgi:hypothetical protein
MNTATDNRTIDELHRAIESAIQAGWTPERLIAEARGSWHDALFDKLNADMKAFNKAQK